MRLIDADEIRWTNLEDGFGRIKECIAFATDIDTMPAVEVVRCKDCKYFELNHWENVNGIPLIVAHEICTKWGDGCKTSKDGYCFLAERKEE